MSIESRLTALESAAGAGACSTCGAGGSEVRFAFIDIDRPAPPPKPCPQCGRLPFRFTVDIGARKPIKLYEDIDDGD